MGAGVCLRCLAAGWLLDRLWWFCFGLDLIESAIHVHMGDDIGKSGLWKHSDGVLLSYRYQNRGLVNVPDPSDKIISYTIKSYCCKAGGVYTSPEYLYLYLLCIEPPAPLHKVENNQLSSWNMSYHLQVLIIRLYQYKYTRHTRHTRHEY